MGHRGCLVRSLYISGLPWARVFVSTERLTLRGAFGRSWHLLRDDAVLLSGEIHEPLCYEGICGSQRVRRRRANSSRLCTLWRAVAVWRP